MSIQEIANNYVAKVNAAEYMELINSMYSEDAVSVESVAAPGQERIAQGRAAILAKNEGFDQSHEVHSQTVRGPWPHGEDKFAVHMSFEMTHLESGYRRTVDEIAVLTVREGKIVKEEFFYAE